MVLDATGPSASQYGFPTCVFKIKITFPMDMIHLVGQCYPVLNHCHVCCATAWLNNMLCTDLNNMFAQSLRTHLVDLNNMFGAPTCRRAKRGHPTTYKVHLTLTSGTYWGPLVSGLSTREEAIRTPVRHQCSELVWILFCNFKSTGAERLKCF